jgi:hypothetical protein
MTQCLASTCTKASSSSSFVSARVRTFVERSHTRTQRTERSQAAEGEKEYERDDNVLSLRKAVMNSCSHGLATNSGTASIS